MKIAVLLKKEESAVSYYRSTGPIAALCRATGWQFLPIKPDEFTADSCHAYDILFAHRPVFYAEVAAIWTAKEHGVKVVVDLDDCLWKIPVSNTAHNSFGKGASDNLALAMQNADAITTSTDALKREIKIEYGRESLVIPNAYNDRLPILPFDTKEGPIKMVYRGSNTHHGDLYTHRGAFKSYSNIELTFIGDMPWFLFQDYGGWLTRIFHEPWTSLSLYFRRIRSMNPHFFIFPLENNEFNRCKSNIAAIEATQAGAICIAPSYMPEFQKFPCIHYDNQENLIETLDLINTDPEKTYMPDLHKRAVKYIETNLKISQVNNLRKELFETLKNS